MKKVKSFIFDNLVELFWLLVCVGALVFAYFNRSRILYFGFLIAFCFIATILAMCYLNKAKFFSKLKLKAVWILLIFVVFVFLATGYENEVKSKKKEIFNEAYKEGYHIGYEAASEGYKYDDDLWLSEKYSDYFDD